MVVNEALNLVYTYLQYHYKQNELTQMCSELGSIAGQPGFTFEEQADSRNCTYEEIQNTLSKLNEKDGKESIRKSKGVYYTPADVVRFILINSIKQAYGKLTPDNIHEDSLEAIPYLSFCTKKTMFDPTCGAGEYLLAALELKMNLFRQHRKSISKQALLKMVSTIRGNDINGASVIITKLRLFLCVLERYGIQKCKGLSEVLNAGFTTSDYVTRRPDDGMKYHIIVGNPPYVEDSKSGLNHKTKYGNIYANVLKNATEHLYANGCMGFIIPLSYISTPRMQNIRKDLSEVLTEQYILSYADRPDCLFDSVHQKLCILIGKNVKSRKAVYTGNYQYWYKEERDGLFARTQVIRNRCASRDCIPKLGTEYDCSIYKKIMNSAQHKSVYEISRAGSESVWLNRRESFWMKAYRTYVNDPEYKVFSFETPGEADYCYCLINSSLFWWYWISVSDCWHVSRELNGFMAPWTADWSKASRLAAALQAKLEATKVYVGTKQTEYEYKHRECIREIHEIDDFVNELYGLSEAESSYIKGFAFRYRTSGGIETNEGS